VSHFIAKTYTVLRATDNSVEVKLQGESYRWSEEKIALLKSLLHQGEEPTVLGLLTDVNSATLTFMHATPKWYGPIVTNLKDEEKISR
jgi:hypothetical protein